jgi:hypothetical protein
VHCILKGEQNPAKKLSQKLRKQSKIQKIRALESFTVSVGFADASASFDAPIFTSAQR